MAACDPESAADSDWVARIGVYDGDLTWFDRQSIRPMSDSILNSTGRPASRAKRYASANAASASRRRSASESLSARAISSSQAWSSPVSALRGDAADRTARTTNIAPLNRPAHDRESVQATGIRIAQKVLGDADITLDTLRGIGASDLVMQTAEGFRLPAAVEGYVLKDNPAILFEKGLQQSRPFIAGTNTDEGTMFSGDTYSL